MHEAKDLTLKDEELNTEAKDVEKSPREFMRPRTCPRGLQDWVLFLAGSDNFYPSEGTVIKKNVLSHLNGCQLQCMPLKQFNIVCGDRSISQHHWTTDDRVLQFNNRRQIRQYFLTPSHALYKAVVSPFTILSSTTTQF